MPTPQPPSYCLFWAHQWWPFGDPWWLCMDTQNWAAWVQAFGSILAILGSAWIGWWLHNLQVQTNRQNAISAHLDDVRRTANLLRSAAVKVRTMHKATKSKESLDRYNPELVHQEHLPQMHKAIHFLTEDDAPTADLLMQLIEAQESFDVAYKLQRGQVIGTVLDHERESIQRRLLNEADKMDAVVNAFDKYVKDVASSVGL